MTRSSTWWIVYVAAFAVLMVLTGPAGQAAAQSEEDGGDGKEGEEAEEAATVVEGGAPDVRVLGFHDLEGDCDPMDARFGDCIEEVRFVDMIPAFSGVPATSTQKAQWRNTSQLYAELWEDIAHRWFKDEDVLANTMRLQGWTALPTTSKQWEASLRKDKRVYGVPGPELWLDSSQWVEGARGGSNAFFRRVRYLAPEGQRAQPNMVLLAGRFALRLGFNSRRHDFDLMNGDPMSSGPFFEQMYPYSQAMEASGGELVPLSHFSGFQARGRARGRMQQKFGEMRWNARQEFYIFARLIATQIAQFGLEDYTTNHMRVLTALTAMQSPPGALEQRTGRAGDLVAAALGETDSEEAVEKRLEEGIYRLQHGFEINYFQLPIELVAEYLAELLSRRELDEAFWADFNDVLVYDLEDLLRDAVGPLNGLDEASIGAWVKAYARPGTSEEMVAGHVKRAALNLLVEDLEKEDRDELQTRILLDHVNLEVTSTFDSEEGVLATPGNLVDATAGKWEAVLGKHGYRTAHFSQGLGAVDPTSICTTLDGPDALEEPSFGAVKLDLLFAAEEVTENPDEILWNARGQLPFIMVDSPDVTVPEVEKLVSLPDGRALYRARWEIWSGWHLFWTSQNFAAAQNEQQRELLVRTGAVCEDTVLSAPELVPTLVRAAMLDGNLRPTTPVMKGKRYRPTHELETASEDEVINAALVQADEAEAAAAQAEQVAAVTGEVPDTIPDSVDLTTPAVFSLFGGPTGEGAVEELRSNTAYFHEVLREPLYELTQGNKPMMLMVFDSTTSYEHFGMRDRRPRTPYARRQLRVLKPAEDEDRWLRTAAWAHYVTLQPDKAFHLISPNYRTTESVATRTPMPRWGRNRSTDFNLMAGFGFFPIRYARASCDDLFEDADPSTVYCQSSARFTEGISIDIGALATWWVVDDHRFGLEMGPSVNLDITPGGTSGIWGQYDDRTNAWALRPQFGVLFGLRGAPNPAPMVLRSKRRLPWGAETPDGASRVGRVQLGFRAGFLLGPGFNGLEGTVPLELWVAGSLRNKRSPHASFTPYQPATLLGPFIRTQLEFVLAADETRFKKLDYGITAIIGIRGQIRVKQKAEGLPEGP